MQRTASPRNIVYRITDGKLLCGSPLMSRSAAALPQTAMQARLRSISTWAISFCLHPDRYKVIMSRVFPCSSAESCGTQGTSVPLVVGSGHWMAPASKMLPTDTHFDVADHALPFEVDRIHSDGWSRPSRKKDWPNCANILQLDLS